MGVRELIGDSKGVPASEKVKNHCSRNFLSIFSSFLGHHNRHYAIYGVVYYNGDVYCCVIITYQCATIWNFLES